MTKTPTSMLSDSPREPAPARDGIAGRRRRWINAFIIAIPVAAVAVGGSFAANQVEEWRAVNSTTLLPQTSHVPLPPITALPQRVVAAYVQAINAHDAVTARALVMKTSRSESAAVEGWLVHATSMTNLKVQHVVGGPVETELAVSFDLQLNVDPPDIGFSHDGNVWWFISLRRDTPSGRWLISSEGSGP